MFQTRNNTFTSTSYYVTLDHSHGRQETNKAKEPVEQSSANC